jgi:hypothetical protein
MLAQKSRTTEVGIFDESKILLIFGWDGWSQLMASNQLLKIKISFYLGADESYAPIGLKKQSHWL